MRPVELCAYERCKKPLGRERVTLPEDGRNPDARPQFCSSDCACNERIKRKWSRKERRYG